MKVLTQSEFQNIIKEYKNQLEEVSSIYVLHKLKNRVKAHLDLTKTRLDLLIKASKYINSLSNVDFEFSDINCRLKINFSNKNDSFFDSIDYLISKQEGFPNDV